MTRPAIASTAALILVLGYAGLVGLSAPDDKTWTSYGGSADSSRYFNSKQINRDNVAKLEVVWSYPFGEAVFHPLIAHGTVYGRGHNGALVALDARTGKELWIHDGMLGMTARGMNYWESRDGKDRRLIFSMNDYLQEIDASTGKSIMTFGDEGVVDLREGLGRDPAAVARIQSGTPGQVFENLIILGSATGEGYMSAPGDLRAYDVLSGKLAWQFHTVPHPGEFGYDTWPKDAWKYIGGTNTWGELTIDEKRGIAYFPTASPTYDFYGADRIGANLFSDCLLALDARTGKRLWHFQTTHHDIWDYDNNAAPQLTTINRDGKRVDVVALAGKTGFLYVFDRVTGNPIWPIEERPVPTKSDMPGEELWPTQPFPTKPPPFVRQSFSADDISPYSNVTEAARQQFKEKLASAKNVGLFTPITTQWTVHTPGNNGGALFGTTSAEPTTGRVYVVGQNNPSVLRLYKPGEGPSGPGAATLRGQAVFQRDCQVCHGADRAGTQTGPTLLTLPGRLDAVAIREVIAGGRGSMPAFSHLSAEDADQVTSYLLSPAGRDAAAGAGGRGAGARVSTAPPELVVATGSAKARAGASFGRGRGPAPVYPPGVEPYVQYSINGAYGTIGNLMKPPYTTITAYDLNKPAIKWQVGFGDDPSLAADGVTGTGVTQMRNGVVVTAGGLLFGIGGDGRVRAYDSDTGQVRWVGKVGGGTPVRGSPSMYELDGRQYLLVPLGSPSGYVTFALPKK